MPPDVVAAAAAAALPDVPDVEAIGAVEEQANPPVVLLVDNNTEGSIVPDVLIASSIKPCVRRSDVALPVLTVVVMAGSSISSVIIESESRSSECRLEVVAGVALVVVVAILLLLLRLECQMTVFNKSWRRITPPLLLFILAPAIIVSPVMILL